MSDALLPIVIGAITAGSFECLGDGLLHDGVRCEQPNTLKDLLVPTKSSRRTPIEDRDRPKKWWKAQCLHYDLGVPSQAPISTYRVHLENAIRQRGGLKRPQDLANLESEQNAKFRSLNTAVRDATSRTEVKAPKAKVTGTKPQVGVESKQKAKAEPKTNLDPGAPSKSNAKTEKLKPKARLADRLVDQGVASNAQTTSKKRKADAVVHIYHYDGNHRPDVSPEDVQHAKRPIKKARKVAPESIVSSNINPHANSLASSSQSYSNTGGSSSIQTGILGMFSGTYELECTSSEVRRSYQKPILKIMIFGGDFSAILILPDLLTCVLRAKNNALPTEGGYMRFEWCGRDDWRQQVQPPRPDQVGWLKLNKLEGRVKGMIKTSYGELLFQGPRVDTAPPVMQWRWTDFEDAMDMDGPYY